MLLPVYTKSNPSLSMGAPTFMDSRGALGDLRISLASLTFAHKTVYMFTYLANKTAYAIFLNVRLIVTQI